MNLSGKKSLVFFSLGGYCLDFSWRFGVAFHIRNPIRDGRIRFFNQQNIRKKNRAGGGEPARCQVESPPKVVSISPVSGDPNVKIDSPVKISFDKSTVGYDVNFVIEPFSNYNFSYDDSRKDFTILPKGNLDYARDYAVSVKLAPSSAKLRAAQMPEIFRANFKTEPSPPPPPRRSRK